MTHDGQLSIAVGKRANAKKWHNRTMRWSALSEKLTTEYRTYETMDEYLGMNKEEQSRIKDVGGFVGGYLKDGRRLNRNVEFRQVLSLDLDDARLTAFDELTKLYPVAGVCYSTHKHMTAKPRLRIVLPLSRQCSPEEYEAVGRRVADAVGMEMFDPSTFQPARLMYWPSTPKDGDFFSATNDAPWLDVDEVLDTYFDWHDTSEWPRAAREAERVQREHDKQEDPTTKKGIVGAFCRAYTVSRAIDEHLTEVYHPTDFDDRYTYTEGSTSCGLVLYDDLWAYSNHSTDPAGQKLCNAFDLVRIHLYGHLDEDGQDGVKAPSYKAMAEWASELPDVKAEMVDAALSEARMDFNDDAAEGSEDDREWMKELEMDGKTIKSIAPNFSLIFDNDPRLQGKFKYNAFTHREYITGTVPWRKVTEWVNVEDRDLAGIRSYIESVYGMSAPQKLDDALTLEIHRHAFHPVKEYLASVKWDGVPRIDRLLIDFMGAKDTLYTREVIRKTLLGAVARVMTPGVKFDQMLVLVGPQGCGKSTFVAKLGGEWFSDSFTTVQGKEAYEAIQGVWLMEMGELAGIKKADVEPTKLFISKTEDRFRPAYGRKVETFKRQTVFVGTTNNLRFLKDPTGNRRFYPVDVRFGSKNVFGEDSDLDKVRDQVWAEAYAAWQKHEPLILSRESERLAAIERDEHQELDERTGLIEGFLDMLLPRDWDRRGINARRRYVSDPEQQEEEGVVEREYACLSEVWCECFGKDLDSLSRYNTRDVTEAMASLEGWEQGTGMMEFPLYGKQRYYQRKANALG